MDEIDNAALLDLSGKTAIVTGGAKGIGLGIVKRFAAAGAKVVIADTDAETAAQEAVALGEKTLSVAVNVAEKQQVDAMVETAVKTFGSVDILVNNAGIFPNVPITGMEEADFKKVIDVNLLGVFLATKAAAEQMKLQGKGGKIINVTSIDAIHPSMIGLAHYDASKHGVWGFTKNAALELAEHNISVNAIAPGGISTPGVAAMSQGASGADMEAATKAFLAQIPMHRMGEPDDIGKVALFLASDMSSYMTGTQVVVDGGALLS